MSHVVFESPGIREELPPGTWVRDSAGRVGQVMDRRPEALHAFSGRAGREDGLAAYLLKREIRCTEVDTVIHSKRHDLLDDATFKRLRSYAQQGRFQVGFFGVPCSTFSVARLHPEGTEPRAVRDRENKYGLPDITPEERREADRANELVRRSVSLAYEIVNRGGMSCLRTPPTGLMALRTIVWYAHCTNVIGTCTRLCGFLMRCCK